MKGIISEIFNYHLSTLSLLPRKCLEILHMHMYISCICPKGAVGLKLCFFNSLMNFKCCLFLYKYVYFCKCSQFPILMKT